MTALVRKPDDACFGPRDDVVVSAAVAVEERAPLWVARPFWQDARDQRMACQRVERCDVGLDVGARVLVSSITEPCLCQVGPAVNVLVTNACESMPGE